MSTVLEPDAPLLEGFKRAIPEVIDWVERAVRFGLHCNAESGMALYFSFGHRVSEPEKFTHVTGAPIVFSVSGEVARIYFDPDNLAAGIELSPLVALIHPRIESLGKFVVHLFPEGFKICLIDVGQVH